ncbi:hypothetical protein GBA52_025982 [Prunus armeniaca]|nr:hypothetical protein GBA52_025982 [Prunus armeniaca]
MDIVVEMDSVNAVNLILSNDLNICHPMAGLVSSCKRLLSQIPRGILHHIYREKNVVANRLAAWSHDIVLGCWFLEENLTWLGPLLLDDSIGVTKTRIGLWFLSLSHSSPRVWAQEMGLSFGAPKQPKTSISWLINRPHESLLPSIPQPTQASPGHLHGLGPLKLVAWLGAK